MMLWKIAWRNLWRNKRRSAIILTSIVIGVVALVLTDTIYTGMGEQMLDNQIGLHAGHLQVHKKGYQDNPLLETAIEEPQVVERALESEPEIEAFARRIMTFGLLSSAYNSSGVQIVGIEPDNESRITLIARSLRRGTYLTGREREILVSEELADKLEVDLGDKVVAMASRLDGSVGSEVFRIVGIFRTFDSEFDKSTVYVPLTTLGNMLGMGQRVSEYVAIVRDLEKAPLVKARLAEVLGNDFEVLTYKDVLPLLVYYVELIDQFMYIYYVIIGIALIFGIINTMLMAVFERIREIGVLKAIGMPDRKIFAMVMLESAVLGLVGTGVGAAIGFALYAPLSHSGINLAMFAESLSSFGLASVIYPVLEPRIVITTFVSIPLFAVLGAIYPALRAVRFHPIEAMRYV